MPKKEPPPSTVTGLSKYQAGTLPKLTTVYKAADVDRLTVQWQQYQKTITQATTAAEQAATVVAQVTEEARVAKVTADEALAKEQAAKSELGRHQRELADAKAAEQAAKVAASTAQAAADAAKAERDAAKAEVDRLKKNPGQGVVK
jgi:chromosome segregation ATPase